MSTNLPLQPEFSEPHIKGAVVRQAKEWIIRTYGRSIYEHALGTLPKEQATVIDADLLSVGWYPVVTWNAFLSAVRRRVKAELGEDDATFDRRNIFETAPPMLTKVYRFVFGFFEPQTVVKKITPVLQRIYSHGELVVTSHEPGRLVMTFRNVPQNMLDEVKRYFPICVEFMLDLAGQEVTEMRPIVSNQGTIFSEELRVAYRKKGKK
jgi:hypothetical protein